MQHHRQLTQSPVLAKNTVFNLLGYGFPLIVALYCIPKIVAGLGTDRFGILTLAWVLIGYFGLLDLGLGRALTQVVAEKLGTDQTNEIPATIWTALLGMLMFSISLSIILFFSSKYLVHRFLNVPPDIVEETVGAFHWVAISVPVVIVSVGLRGILEAYQRFDLVNAVRIPLGVFSFAAPLAVIPFTVNLQWVIIVLFFGRLFATGCQFLFCRRIIPGLIAHFSIDTKGFWILMRFGGWMTVTNIINPLLVYVDRFFIASLLTTSAVTYYATPSEMIMKIALFSGALMSVLFPAISSSFKVDRPHSAFLLERGLIYVFLIIFPLVVILFSFTPEILTIWLDEEFMRNSSVVARILLAGVLFYCLGQIVYAFVLGAGRPDLTGKLHLIELPLYIFFVILGIYWAGIVGAAIIWALRFIGDTTCMLLMARRMLGNQTFKIRAVIVAVFMSLLAMCMLAMPVPLQWRMVGCLIVLVAFLLLGWRYLLSAREKDMINQVLRMASHLGGSHRG